MIEAMRNWQKKNQQWELVCDAGNTDHYYEQWHELPKAERMSWIGTYGSCAKDAFEDFAAKRCKTITMCLNDKLELVKDWPSGFAMLVFLKR